MHILLFYYLVISLQESAKFFSELYAIDISMKLNKEDNSVLKLDIID